MKRILIIAPIALAAAGILISTPGCLTSKTQTVTNGVTNIVVTVNEANLALDSVVLQGATSIAVAPLLEKYPELVQPLKDAHTALDGIINGANTNTTQQIIAMLKAQNNPALTQQVTLLVQNVSTVEQNLIMKYGVTVTGEITIALARAVDAGLVIGLRGIEWKTIPNGSTRR